MEIQLELDLKDKFQKYEIIAKKMLEYNKYQNYTTIQLYRQANLDGSFNHYLGTRTFYYDTEYTYDHKIDEETAIYLHEKLGINDFMGWYGKLKQKEKIVTCKICGCSKTVEELKKEHSKCFVEDKDV